MGNENLMKIMILFLDQIEWWDSEEINLFWKALPVSFVIWYTWRKKSEKNSIYPLKKEY